MSHTETDVRGRLFGFCSVYAWRRRQLQSRDGRCNVSLDRMAPYFPAHTIVHCVQNHPPPFALLLVKSTDLRKHFSVNS